MIELPVPRSEIITRLKKIEGQVKGVERMVESERDCIEIMTQLAAIKAAMESVANRVIRNYAVICSENKGSDIACDLAHAMSIWFGGKG